MIQIRAYIHDWVCLESVEKLRPFLRKWIYRRQYSKFCLVIVYKKLKKWVKKSKKSSINEKKIDNMGKINQSIMINKNKNIKKLNNLKGCNHDYKYGYNYDHYQKLDDRCYYESLKKKNN